MHKKVTFLFLSSLLVATNSLAVTTLKLAESWMSNYPIFGDTTRHFAALVNDMSNGRLVIQIDSNDVHNKPLGIFDLVKSGQYDIGHSAPFYWLDEIPNTMYFTTMPFGMLAVEQYAWFYKGGGMELMDEVYRPYNLYSFPGGNTGQQMGGWFQKEINSVADLRGLKMRIPGFAGELMRDLGVQTQNIPGGQLYKALSSGSIDAAEWVGPSLDLSMGFSDIAKYYYTGWAEPATELQFLVNRKTMDALPADLQEILKVAMRLSAYDMWVQLTHENAKNWQTMLKTRKDIQVRSFPPEVMEALREINDRKLRERADADPLAARIIASQADYMLKARAWMDISERAFIGNVDPDGNKK